MMNTNQISIILQYLQLETNYAVIINGKYGVGKTHFYKSELVPHIKQTPLLSDNTKMYIPIHVSLFGFKTLEEIQTAIFCELHPILKSKNLRLSLGIGKSLIRGIAQIMRAGDIDKYINDVSQKANDWLNYSELVICFDDLDRKSETLSLTDIFGFINSLVENEGSKVLIIANDSLLPKDEKYITAREKVIGVSMEYIPNVKSIFRQIVDIRYSNSWKSYYDLLQKSENKIIEVVEVNQCNFRNLIFFLEHFKVIYDSVEEIIQRDKTFAVQRDTKLSVMLEFTIAVTMEYKLGSLNSSNFGELKKMKSKVIIDHFKDESEIKEESNQYIDIFRSKYYSQKEYFYFESILNYIIGIQAFDIDFLKLELDKIFKVFERRRSEVDEVMDKLSYSTCELLTDQEYRSLTLKMLKHVDQGELALKQYATAFHFAIRFNNLLNLSIEKTKRRIKRGISKGISRYVHDANLDFHLSTGNIENREQVIEIVDFCLDINRKLGIQEDQKKVKELLNLFQTDFIKFLAVVDDRESNYRHIPFWSEFQLSKVARRVQSLSNREIMQLITHFHYRYLPEIYHKIAPEKDFLIKLRNEINRPVRKRRIKNLHNVYLNLLSSQIAECEKNFT